LNPSTSTYFPALTGIRALAVLMVYFHHFNPFSGGPESCRYAYRFFAEFHIGVTLFFVLSGFIITHKYFIDRSVPVSVYLWNRFTKIYPVFFVLTLLTFLLRIFFLGDEGEPWGLALLLNLLLLKGYFSDFLFSGIAQAWTLTVEETFYLTVPALAWAWHRVRWPLLVLPAAIIALGLLIQFFLGGWMLLGFMGDAKFMFNFTFFGRCFEFLIGMALAYNLRYQVKFKYMTLFGVMSMVLSLLALTWIGNETITGDNFPLGIVVNNFGLPLFGIVPLYYGLIYENTWLRKLLSGRLFRILGESSYVFYLIHIGVIQLALSSFGFSIYTNLLILYCCAIIGYYLFELPVKEFLRRKRFQLFKG
jgi:peptidoglycan/LPS O-acetylase OafA/YrhL